MKEQLILFFLKYPEPGEVKTRIAMELPERGEELAAELARAMAEDMLDELKWVEETDLCVCFSPRERADDMAAWLGGREYEPQRGPELGRRMKNAFLAAFRKGYERVVLLGSDIPDVHDADLRAAFEHLRQTNACVLGPSEDRGYWLIGFDAKGMCAEVFVDMDWGWPGVLEQTVRRLEFDERKVGYVSKRRDVDTLADLEAAVRGGTLKKSSKTLRLGRKLLGGGDQ